MVKPIKLDPYPKTPLAVTAEAAFATPELARLSSDPFIPAMTMNKIKMIGKDASER